MSNGLRRGKIGSRSINTFLPTVGTPVNGAVSKGTLTVDTQPTADDTMTVGSTTYTFKAGATAAADEIGIGGDLAASQAAIVAAINGTDGFNNPNLSASAADFAANDSVLTSKIGGAGGNAVDTTETFTAVTNVFDAATLGTTQAGVSGTVAEKGEAMIDDTYLYFCLDDNTLNGANWRRIALGSAY